MNWENQAQLVDACCAIYQLSQLIDFLNTVAALLGYLPEALFPTCVICQKIQKSHNVM